MLFKMEFSYEKSGKGLIGKYIVEGISAPEIKIDKQNSQRIMKSILSSLSRNPRFAIPFHRILIVEGITLEAQIAMINAMVRRDLIHMSSISFLTITENGKETLQLLQG